MVTTVNIPTMDSSVPLSPSGETANTSVRSFLSHAHSLTKVYFENETVPPSSRQFMIDGIRMVMKNLEGCFDNEEVKLWGSCDAVQRIARPQYSTYAYDATLKTLLLHLESVIGVYFEDDTLPPSTRQHMINAIRMAMKNLEDCIGKEEDNLWRGYAAFRQATHHQNSTPEESSDEYGHNIIQASSVTDNHQRKRIFQSAINSNESNARTASEEEFAEEPRKIESAVASVAKPPAKKRKGKKILEKAVSNGDSDSVVDNRTHGHGIRKNKSTISLASADEPADPNSTVGTYKEGELTNNGMSSKSTFPSRSISSPPPNKLHRLKPRSAASKARTCTGEDNTKRKQSSLAPTSSKTSGAAKPVAHHGSEGRKSISDGKSTTSARISRCSTSSVPERNNDLDQLIRVPVVQQALKREHRKGGVTKNDFVSKRNPAQLHSSTKVKQCAMISTMNHLASLMKSSENEDGLDSLVDEKSTISNQSKSSADSSESLVDSEKTEPVKGIEMLLPEEPVFTTDSSPDNAPRLISNAVAAEVVDYIKNTFFVETENAPARLYSEIWNRLRVQHKYSYSCQWISKYRRTELSYEWYYEAVRYVGGEKKIVHTSESKRDLTVFVLDEIKTMYSGHDVNFENVKRIIQLELSDVDGTRRSRLSRKTM